MKSTVKKCIRLIIITITLTLCSTVYSQKSDTGNWFIYFGNQSINKKWNWYNELQYRNYNFIGDTQQLILRTGIGYNLTDGNNNVLLGYAYINSYRYIPNFNDKILTNEHRIYQQFITKQNFGRIFIQHRYRVEERFLKDDFKMRFRYFLSLNIPITSKIMSPKTVYLSGYNEIFINNNTPIFDRNRIYAGVGYVIDKNFKLEIGYMNQSLENSSRNQFQIILFNNLPF